jgi:hypothetical protein
VRWNGLLSQIAENGEQATKTPERLAEAVDVVRKLRAEEGLSMEGFDVVVEGDMFGGWVEHVAPLSDWEAAGGTWWVESWWNVDRDAEGLAEVRLRFRPAHPTSPRPGAASVAWGGNRRRRRQRTSETRKATR